MYLQKNYQSSFKIASKGRVLLMVSAVVSYANFAYAAPSGGVVTSGSATINSSGSSTTINQASQKTIINWQDFSIGKNESVTFNQPNTSAIALNRVVGNNQSVLEGVLNANGKVFLVNPNGVLISKGAKVNTAGFLASALNITDDNFNKDKFIFEANGAGGNVINLGAIEVKEGGYVVLMGKQVSNEGTITATKGTVALSSGNKITLNFDGTSLVDVTIDEGTLNSLVETKQAIYADGGKVILTAKAANELIASQVNIEGLVQAQTIDDLKGDIKVYAYGGTANIKGTIDASAPTKGDGGFIETSGDKVKIADSAFITTKALNGKSGIWLIDPLTFTIGSNGDITGSAVKSALTNNGVFIASASDGDININDAIDWSSGTLKLYASKNVNVNNILTATGTAGLEASYGYLLDGSGLPTSTLTNGTGKDTDGVPYGLYMAQGGGESFSGRIDFSGSGGVRLNGTNYTVISNAADMAAITQTGHYVLGADLGNTFLNQTIPNFDGSFNGFGHTIQYANDYSTSNQVGGLFGTLGSTAMVSNLGLTWGARGGSVIGIYGGTAASVGSLVNINQGSIVNSFSSVEVNGVAADNGNSSIGGLVGTNSGLIAESYYARSTVTAVKVAGGLVGTNETSGRIIDSSSHGGGTSSFINGSATTTTYVGGLVGVNKGDIKRSWTSYYVSTGTSSTVSTTIPNFMGGGFVGLNTATGTISQSYADRDTSSANVGGTSTTATAANMDRMGGFVGDNQGTISDAYAYSTMTGNAGVTNGKRGAGFAYKNSGTIRNAYARWATNITAAAQAYGFVYDNTGGTLENVYWSYLSFSGLNSKAPIGIGITSNGTTNTAATDTLPSFGNTAAAASLSNYTGFDSSIWGSAVSGYPMLKNLNTLYVVNNPVTSLSYGDNLLGTQVGSLWVVGLQAGDTRATVFPTTIAAGINPNLISNGYLDVGTYTADEALNFSVAAATANAYKMQGSFTVKPKQLTLAQTGVIANKVYDGTTDATLINTTTAGLTGLVGSQTLGLTYTASFSTKNVAFDGIGDLPASSYKYITLEYTSVSDGVNGGKASNYILPVANSPTFAKITPLALNATNLQANANNKTYDSTSAATASIGSNNTLVQSEMTSGLINLSYLSALFSDANAGNGKSVGVSGITMNGSGAGNYTLATTTLTSTADITPRAVNVFGSGSPSGSQVGTNELALGNIVSGDSVHLSGTATLVTSNQGSNPLNLSGLTIDNPNYTLVGAVGSYTVGDMSRTALSNSGGVSFDNANNPSVITTTNDKSIINWQNFSIGVNENVQFVQPHAYSIVLNRVLGNSQTIIAGALNSNGRVFIVNPNGVLFSAGSVVNTSALLASTLNISDVNFNSGNYVFTASGGNGSVISEGDIVIVDGGFLGFVSDKSITSNGAITANNSKAILASVKNLTLNIDETSNALTGYSLSDLSGSATLSNTINLGNGLLETAAESLTDTATLTAGSRSISLPNITIGSGGTYSAAYVNSQLALRNLKLNALSGNLTLKDNISWSSDSKFALAARDNILIQSRISSTGTNAGLSLKSTDYTIDSARLDYDGVTTIGYANAGVTLSGSNASLSIDGNAYTLIRSMNDFGQINTNSGVGYYAIAQNIDAIGNTYNTAVVSNLSGKLAGLGNKISNLAIDAGMSDNIGLVGTATAGSVIRDLGIQNASIKAHANVGILLGNGNGVTLNNAWTSGILNGVADDTVTSSIGDNRASARIGGLAGYLQSSTITNSHSDANVIGAQSIRGGRALYTGGLVGDMSGTSIGRSYATGDVTGGDYTAGLVGHMANGSLSYVWASGNVTGMLDTAGAYSEPDDSRTNNYSTYVGGLVGKVENISGNSLLISHVKASGNVLGGAAVGGLIGMVGTSVAVNDAHASGDVGLIAANSAFTHTHSFAIGGLVGSNAGSISDSTASGNVIAEDSSQATVENVGGLVGDNGPNASITNSSATGNVKADLRTGGLVGKNQGRISGSWASGNVRVTSSAAGGFVGENYGNIENSWASGNVTGWNSLGGFAGGNGGTISNSQAKGDVTSTDTGLYGQRGTYVGGFAGGNTGTLDSVSAEGDTTGGDRAGALVGANTGTVKNSTASGELDTGSWESGGLIGNNSGNVDSVSRWNNKTHEQQLQQEQHKEQAATARQLASDNQAQAQKQTASAISSVLSTFMSSSQKEDMMSGVNLVNKFETGVKSITVDGVTYTTEESNEDDHKNKKAH